MSSYTAIGSQSASRIAGSAATTTRGERLVWLDILRLLSALMILGIHWLRACAQVGLFGIHDKVNLVMGYQGQSIGLKMLPHVLIAGTGLSLAVWLTNLIGLLGGFGWEGVSALIIVSGFSLTIALGQKIQTGPQWLAWLRKRAVRILVPFYLVAIPFLITYLVLLSAAAHMHGSFARSLEVKLHSLLPTSPLGVVLSHTLLLDPFASQWQPVFFAPAWWFVPAILIAYVVYPLLISAVRRFGSMQMLAIGALTTFLSYGLADRHVLVNESYYFIVLQEAFNFTLGVVVGQAWLNRGARLEIEKILFDSRIFLVGLLMFVAGNIANWSPSTRPFASMLFGPGLVVMLVVIARALERTRFARFATSIDSYDLYLVHQPFAFPVALVAKAVFHSYAVFFGWFIFFGVTSLATFPLAFVQRIVERRPPNRDKAVRVHPTT